MSLHPSAAILRAIAGGATTKTVALQQAYDDLRDARSHHGREDLQWHWHLLEQSGRIVREGRRWRVAEGTVLL